MTQHSWKPYNFIKLKQVDRETYWESIYWIKLPSASTISSIQDLNLLQAFDTVLLARDPTTSLIFQIWAMLKLWSCALTLNFETPRTIYSAGLQAGELGGQITFSHTSMRFFLSQSCVLLLLSAGALVQCIVCRTVSLQLLISFS